MTILSYDLETSLPGHIDSINALQFSSAGGYLASSGQDGQLFIFSTKTWKPVRKYANASPLTALVWHPTFPKTVICGFASGDLVTICFDGTQVYLSSLSSQQSTLHFLGPQRGKDLDRQDVRCRRVYRPRRSGSHNRNRTRRETISDRPDDNMCVLSAPFHTQTTEGLQLCGETSGFSQTHRYSITSKRSYPPLPPVLCTLCGRRTRYWPHILNTASCKAGVVQKPTSN